MNHFVKAIFWMLFVIPLDVVKFGLDDLSHYLNEDDPLEAFLWILVVILSCLAAILLMMGHRFNIY